MLLPAGFIDGGRVYGETLRRALYASTAGATGVVRSDDLRVVALATPGPAVVISPGAGVVATRYTDADPGQSYSVSVGAALTLPVPANDSPSTRTWHVIIRVTDPQYVGESVPDDPEDATYTVAELVATLPTTRPFLHLATLRIPANTGVVNPSAVADTRRIAQPRSERFLRTIDVPGDAQANHSDPGYARWPGAAGWSVYVPEWATHARVQANWQAVRLRAGWSVTQCSVQLGGDTSSPWHANPSTMVVGHRDGAFTAPEETRGVVGVADEALVPAAWRGRTITAWPMARLARGSSTLWLDNWSSVSLDIQFTESAQQ